MKRKYLFLIVLLALLLATYFYISKDFVKAEATIYHNGNLITLEKKLPLAQAMLVENGFIKAIGTNEEILKLEANHKVIDLKGATVLPGFIDPHTHVALSAFLDNMVDLSGFTHQTADQVWNLLKEAVKLKKHGEWIVCRGIDPILVQDLKSPNLTFLDEVAPDNPLILISQSLHTYWVNSKTFEKAKITNATPNPSKSSFYEKDSLGNLTGLIAEQKAFLPILEQMKKEVMTSKILIKSTTKVLKDYARNGNTTIVSAGITINNAKPLRLYKYLSTNKPSLMNGLLEKLGILPPRTQNPRHFIYIRFDKAFLLPESRDWDDDFYGIIGIKHWYDGSPYTGSMYIEEPYMVSNLTQQGLHIPEGYSGKPLIKDDDLVNFIKKYHTKGWQIAIHTQGDIANRKVLETFEKVNEQINIQKGKHRIEHCVLLSEESLDRMKEFNITPSFHINHLYYYGRALQDDIIGKERANKILPVGTAQRKNLVYSLHADQPMFESKPFHLIQTAVERQTKEGDTLGFYQKISVLEGLKAMTINAAWQINMEKKIGSLEKGKYADFIVLDKNPLKIPTNELKDIKILQTFINGNKVE